MASEWLPQIEIGIFAVHWLILFFAIFGWIFARTRLIGMVFVLGTLLSWHVIGFWKGIGYCALWDLQIWVRNLQGRETSSSFFDFSTELFGFSSNPKHWLTREIFFHVGFVVLLFLYMFLERRRFRTLLPRRSVANTRGGFTLLELMVSLAIIGVLASIGTVQYREFALRSAQAEAKANLSAIHAAQISFSFENQSFTGCLPVIWGLLGSKARYSYGFRTIWLFDADCGPNGNQTCGAYAWNPPDHTACPGFVFQGTVVSPEGSTLTPKSLDGSSVSKTAFNIRAAYVYHLETAAAKKGVPQNSEMTDVVAIDQNKNLTYVREVRAP